jgi:hypothetical protein
LRPVIKTKTFGEYPTACEQREIATATNKSGAGEYLYRMTGSGHRANPQRRVVNPRAMPTGTNPLRERLFEKG